MPEEWIFHKRQCFVSPTYMIMHMSATVFNKARMVLSFFRSCSRAYAFFPKDEGKGMSINHLIVGIISAPSFQQPIHWIASHTTIMAALYSTLVKELWDRICLDPFPVLFVL
jgi:hypothetical protein